MAATIAAAVAAGVDWVQLRERELEANALIELGDAVTRAVRQTATHSVRIIVNRRCDVALAIGADGVHLGFDAVDPGTARGLLGADAWIGVSSHSAQDVREAEKRGASYAHLAPIFPPLSKASSRPALGIEGLVSATVGGIPVLAQGGIDASNASEVVAAGAAGVAVTGSILQADDPGAAAAALRNALDRGRP